MHDALNPLDGSDAYSRSAERVWLEHSDTRWTPNTVMLVACPLGTLESMYRTYTTQSLEVAKTPERRRLSGSADSGILRLAFTSLRTYAGGDKDHVIPLRKCEGLLRAPLNHFANWMPLSASENRSRQDRMWADCWPDPRFDANRNEIAENLVVPYSAVNDAVVADTQSLQAFLTVRAAKLAVPILQTLRHPDVGQDLDAAAVRFEVTG